MIYEWARDHGVPLPAVYDLLQRLGVGYASPGAERDGMSEAAVQQRVRLEAARRGTTYWRNNVGAMRDEAGGFIRFGLCNDTAALNDRFKSGDLIGINSAPITAAMVGEPRGQFMSREVKHGGWVYTGSQREIAQRAWMDLINSKGGDARFTTGDV